ncbi:hypothetical protein ASG11_01885 [Sphingomonas sp. Leaf357]|uniref:hypothetical protein n=1 Tax=Sphingomonas sp. Leaf357 TaxID=1736350 RepID=UPI0006FBA7AA|nr:hypothetical protein [Sphingomonas sp. Leaf357]KQS03167.1 hypothetical protein ASG11_01885 [Sphingomonas sp. Leaf357]
MNWLQFGGSLAAIFALAGVARMLRLGESRIGDAAKAREMAEEMLAGFDAYGAIVGTDGKAALVLGNGTIAVLKRHGAKVAARRLLPPLQLFTAVEGVEVATGERLFGRVLLFGVVESDVRALEAQLTRV